MIIVSLKTNNMKQIPGAMGRKDHMFVYLNSHCRILRYPGTMRELGYFLSQEVSNIEQVLSDQIGALSAHTLKPAVVWLLGNGSNQQSGDWLSGGGCPVGHHVSTWKTLGWEDGVG